MIKNYVCVTCYEKHFCYFHKELEVGRCRICGKPSEYVIWMLSELNNGVYCPLCGESHWCEIEGGGENGILYWCDRKEERFLLP